MPIFSMLQPYNLQSVFTCECLHIHILHVQITCTEYIDTWVMTIEIFCKIIHLLRDVIEPISTFELSFINLYIYIWYSIDFSINDNINA